MATFITQNSVIRPYLTAREASTSNLAMCPGERGRGGGGERKRKRDRDSSRKYSGY